MTSKPASLRPSPYRAARPCGDPPRPRTGHVRRGWRSFRLSAVGCRLDALIGGPLLRDHRNSTDAAVGVIADARVEGDSILIRARFDQSPGASEVMTKVQGGSLRGISLGYKVHRWQSAGKRDGLPVFVATDWTPAEASITPVPASPGAYIRGQSMDTNAAVADGNIMNRAAVNAELRSIGKAAGVAQATVDGWIDGEVSADEARRQAFETLRSRSATNINTSVVTVGVSHDDPAAMTRAMSDALACRLNPSIKVEGRAAEYVGCDLLTMAGELAAVRGEKLSRNRAVAADQLFTRSSHSTSDFPLLLENAVNKSMLPNYQNAAPTYRSWCSQRSFNDFRPHKFLRIGDFPSLSEIGAEGGEPRFGTVSENRETVTPKEYGTGISISRRALINDDLGALQNFTGMIGVRVASDENAMMYSLLASNPTLADSVALFHSSHGNLAASGSALSVDSVGAAVQAMRLQTSLDGIRLNVAPRYLVVGPANELKARQILASIIANQTSNVNPWSGMLELIVDANITGNAWHAFADPALFPAFVYGYVAGTSGPVVRTEIDFHTRAFKIAVGLDFGYGAIDYRGAYKNAGA